MNPHMKPDFERYLTALRCEEPDRVPLGDFHIDPLLVDAFLGRKATTVEDRVAFFQAAGFDYVTDVAGFYVGFGDKQAISTRQETVQTAVGSERTREWANEHEDQLTGQGSQGWGRVLIGTVKGDLHDIGKNLVLMMLEGQGYQVEDLGVSVGQARFVQAVKEKRPDILAMSALLTTTMTEMQTTIQALTEAGLRQTVKVIVGGAPLTQAFADRIGADGYAYDAPGAAQKCRELLGRNR